jgi:predicted membrane-bound spermidine synthase
MAGLGLGNLWAARYGPRLKRPLLVYAAVEVVIGLAGYSLVLLLPLLTPFLTPLFRPLLEFPVLLHSLRLLFAFVLLLIPSTAMGVTLPLLVKTLSARDSNFGRVLGHLYGWNTLGAVAGALAGELYFIGLLGLRGTGLVAASLNLLAALASGLLARRLARAHEPEVGAPDASLPSWRSGQAVRLLAAAFLSGGLLLALEVVWFRFLLLFVLGSSLVFAVMLSVILLGIGAGGLLASLWLGWRPADYRYAPFLAIAASALTVFTYILFDDGFGLYSAMPIRPVSEARIVFPLTAGLCVPVSLLSGMIFTFLGRALGDALGNETKASAALTFANTTGAMLGSLAAGFVLIPFLGVEWSFFLLGLSYGGVAFLSLGAGAYQKTPTREETILFRLATVAVALLFVFFPFGLMKNHYIPLITQPHTQDGSRLVAIREGRTETAIYLRRDLWDQPQYYRLVTNGFSMSASDLGSQRYMSLFAYWPAALHPSPKKALLISYGLGVTARALTEIEGLESIDIVDISETILELNREVGMFPERHPLDDPRARVRIEDGRFILQTIGTSYDIITGEPPPPKMAGIVNLYSKEYFALLRDRLAPGGLATYWLPVHELRVEEAKAIAKAFCSAFADCSLWCGADLDWMLVGSRPEPQPLSDEAFSHPWQSPRSGKGLFAIGVEAPEQLGALFLADASFLNAWTEQVEALEDDYPQRISSHPRLYQRY